MLRRITYRLIAPFYDRLVSRLEPERRRALALLRLSPGDRLLISGIGTGADLPFLQKDLYITGIDASAEMLARAAQRREELGAEGVVLSRGDAMALPFPDGAFDAVVLNLILTVVDDPARAFSEAMRVLRPGGQILVFDKFLPRGERPGLLRRAANSVLSRVGTDINRVFEEIIEGHPLRIVEEVPSWGRGFFRIYLLQKKS